MKAAHLLRRFEFHLLLFGLALLAFTKPTLVPNLGAPATRLLLAYFIPWGALIAVLIAVARSGPHEADEEDPTPDASATEPAPSLGE